MGPCASKKKQTEPVKVAPSNASNLNVNQPVINNYPSSSSLGRSKLIERNLTKSQVRVQ